MKWTDYTTKETLEDNDELMILDADVKANKRTLMSKIWNYVVDKMTSAVVAKLTTTDKTVLGAINELNSKAVTRERTSVVDGTGKIKIPYDIEGVALINVSDYNAPSIVEQSLYIVGMGKNRNEVKFDKIFRIKII